VVENLIVIREVRSIGSVGGKKMRVKFCYNYEKSSINDITWKRFGAREKWVFEVLQGIKVGYKSCRSRVKRKHMGWMGRKGE
jgi:hypothetical protein